MELRVLGPLEVVEDGRPLAVGRGRQRAVLAMLLLHANEVVSGDRLIDELWGESPPRTATAALHNHVSRLRKALGPEPLETHPPGYLLRVRPGELDLDRFESLIREGRERREAGDHAGASHKLRSALALWRGPALADFTYEPFAQMEIARLDELRVVAFEERIDADLAQGHDAELVSEVEAAIRDHPHRERLRGQLMLALYRGGRQADALEVYRETRQTLDDELGIAPSPTLQRLETSILRQEPALELSMEAPREAPPLEAPPGGPGTAPEIRKTVTVLIASRRSAARLDPEVASREDDRFRADVRRIARRFGGAVASSVGGQVLAVFGIPSVHEDDALRAASSAIELRDDLESDVRIGIATGEVLTGASGSAVAPDGPPVALAAELEGAASPAEILVADQTELLVRADADVEPVETASGTAWRLNGLASRPPPLSDAVKTPLVGRKSELMQLKGAFEDAVREDDPRLAALIGPAGIGKTRLAQDFAAAIGTEAAVLAGRCVPYGEGITFWPLTEILRQLSTAHPKARSKQARLLETRLGEAIGHADTSSTQEEIFSAARELFEELARQRALVLVFEDLHWAEPAFLNLIDYLAHAARGAPIVLLCIGRPELLEERPQWGGGGTVALSLLLEPLADSASAAMIANLAADLPEDTRARVLEAAEGNPLFIEQLVAKFEEEGGEGGALLIPPTIEAVLAARLDRLGPGEHAVIGCGAVVGKEFQAAAVADLLPEDARAFVGRHLDALTRRDLIAAPTASPIGGEGFRFRHILIQQAAYRAIPKSLRGDLHERFGRWVEEHPSYGVGERSEIIGYHLEQAFRYRTEFEPAGEAEQELALASGGHLASAGRRAFGRGDMPATANLLGRAASLLANEGEGLSVLPELGYALFEIGEEDRADALLSDAWAKARAAGDRVAEWRAVVTRRRVEMYMDPTRTDPDALATEARAAIEVFDDVGDNAGLARAWLVLSDLHWIEGRLTEAVDASSRAAEHARRAGNLREVGWALGQNALCAIHNPMPVADAQAWVALQLEGAAQNRGLDANLAGFLTVLEAMGGDVDGARRRIEETRALARELGLTWQASVQELNAGYIELLAGDPVSAERQMRVAEQAFAEIGDGWWLSTVACDLPRAVYAQGRYDDALALVERIVATPDRELQIKSRGIRARVLARRGELSEAEVLAREAVSLGATSEFLVLHADALTDLAEVLRVAGRDDEAEAATAAAIRLYERKGSVAAVERLREVAGRA